MFQPLLKFSVLMVTTRMPFSCFSFHRLIEDIFNCWICLARKFFYSVFACPYCGMFLEYALDNDNCVVYTSYDIKARKLHAQDALKFTVPN